MPDEDRPRGQKRVKSFSNKVVIRKLPPNLTQEAFVEIISPLPDLQDFYFCKADWTLGAEATSRAYLEFKDEKDIFIFRDKFDSYIFVDSVRGSEYPAIVEYASFQGLPKSRARKKDKHVSTIEVEQHFLSFLEQLKAEEDETQKFEPKVSVEYSYQLKDDKKITSTPLIEFLSQKKEEKRDARRKKQDDKRKQRDDEKQKKKAQVAKNVPEPIKELKEDTVYEDGIMVRTVPSRLGRNERGGKKESKPEPKLDSKSDSKQKSEEARKEARKKAQKEKDDKRRAERSQQRAKEYEKKKLGSDGPEPSTSFSKETKESKEEPRDAGRGPVEARESKEKKEIPAKPETKRYSALRKARQDKTSDVKEPSDSQEIQDGEPSADAKVDEKKAETVNKRAEWDEAKKVAREKRAEENRERRAREADERAQRQIKNKDRPTLQIYQPKRRQDNDSRGDNMKSSDENSEASRKKSDSDPRGEGGNRRERRTDRNPSRKTSRDETSRRKKSSRKNSDETGKEAAGDVVKVKDEVLAEKLDKLALESPKKSPELVEQKSDGEE